MGVCIASLEESGVAASLHVALCGVAHALEDFDALVVDVLTDVPNQPPSTASIKAAVHQLLPRPQSSTTPLLSTSTHNGRSAASSTFSIVHSLARSDVGNVSG